MIARQQYDTVLLEKITYSISAHINKLNCEKFIGHPTFEVDYLKPIADDLYCRLQTAIYCQKLETQRLVVDYPKTWFQHFKQTYFPQFLLNKFPVQYTTVEKNIEIKAFYPELRLATKEPPQLIFQVLN